MHFKRLKQVSYALKLPNFRLRRAEVKTNAIYSIIHHLRCQKCLFLPAAGANILEMGPFSKNPPLLIDIWQQGGDFCYKSH